MREINVSTNEAGQRLDKLLRKYLKNANTSFIYKMLRKKNIVLNDKKAEGKEILKLGDSVKMYFSEETFEIMTGRKAEEKQMFDVEAFRRHIVYEDEHLLVLNKPSGWLSQSDGSGLPSVNELCLQYLMATGALTEAQLQTFKPGIANRLDRNTSGLILFGKTLPALQALATLLRDRTMEKYYLAIVYGDIYHAQRIDGYLAKDERTNRVVIRPQPFQDAVEIHTAYEPLKRSADASGTAINAVKNRSDDVQHAIGRDTKSCVSGSTHAAVKEAMRHREEYTVLKVHLITGKTHQIRAHLRTIGHPIIGDPKYGRMDANAYYRTHGGVKSQLLHAWELHFPEILDGPLRNLAGRTITAEPPQDFRPFLQ